MLDKVTKEVKGFFWEDKSNKDESIKILGNYMNPLLQSKSEAALIELQTLCIAIYDVHNSIYNQSSPKIWRDDYERKEWILTLYNKLTNENNTLGIALKDICKHRFMNSSKRFFGNRTSFENFLTGTVTKIINDITEVSEKIPGNLVGIYKLAPSIFGVVAKLGIANKKNDTIVFIRHVESYFRLPIIVKDDLNYFLSKLENMETDPTFRTIVQLSPRINLSIF